MTPLHRTFRLPALCVATAALLLAACGGSDDSPPSTATSLVPASASQSVAGFISYLKDLIASSADTLEPVDTAGLTAQTDETAEPVSVD